TVIKTQSSLTDESPRQGFGFFETMQILQHVRAQQHRFLALRIALFDAQRALLGQFVKTRIETLACLRNKRPAELFHAKLEIPCSTDLLLKPRNFFVGATVARLGR